MKLNNDALIYLLGWNNLNITQLRPQKKKNLMDISDQGFSLFLPVEFPTSFLGPVSTIQKCLTLSVVIYYVVIIISSQWREWLEWKELQGNVLEGEMWWFSGVVEGVDQWASFCSLIIGLRSFSIVFFILPLQMLLILPILLNTIVLWIWSIPGVWVLNFILGLV